ncbi:UDP-glucuronosyltransferase 2B33-like [Oculina patagonica]
MAALHGIFFFSLLSSCYGASYVAFPMFSRSHYLVIAKLGEELAARGHEVQVFVGDTETYALKSPLVRPYNTSQAFKAALKQTLKAVGVHGRNVVTEMGRLTIVQAFYCDDVLGNNEVMEAVKRTDLVIGDSLYMCGSLIADKFSLPYVTLTYPSLSPPLVTT